VLTLQVSVAGVSRGGGRPQLALQAAPFDAAARTKLATLLVEADETKPEARELALDAIRRDPIQPAALRVLAQSLDPAKDRSGNAAMALIEQSQRLSRRDVATQMWLIDHYSRLGDVEAAVRQIDVVLRSSETARPAVFPVLELAGSDPRGRRIVMRTLARKPNWARPFAAYAAQAGPNLEFAVEITAPLLDSSKRDDRDWYQALMNRLVQGGRLDLAWDIYRQRGLAPAGAAASTVRNGGFENAEDGSPFDWYFAQESELWSSRDRIEGGDGLVLELAAYNGRSGDVAHQYIRLAPGPHRLRARLGEVPAERRERPEIRLECVSAGGGMRLATLIPERAGAAPSELSATFAVPSNCRFQIISIRIAGDGPLKDRLPWIDNLRIDGATQ